MQNEKHHLVTQFIILEELWGWKVMQHTKRITESFVHADGHRAIQPDTSTQCCCTGAAVAWFMANEYLAAGTAMSEAALAHRCSRGVEPQVAESSVFNTSSCQGESFTLLAHVGLHWCVLEAQRLCAHIYACFIFQALDALQGLSFIPSCLSHGVSETSLRTMK